MINNFDTEVAKDVGVVSAVLYCHIQHWCNKNKENGTNYHDGCYWMFNTFDKFCELFPYLSRHQIVTAMSKLVKHGYIKKGNYNKAAYDRTVWYADLKAENARNCSYSQNEICIFQNGEMEIPKREHGDSQMGTPIPSNYTSNYTNNYTSNTSTNSNNVSISNVVTKDTPPPPEPPPLTEEEQAELDVRRFFESVRRQR